jgi:hypothetical protein
MRAGPRAVVKASTVITSRTLSTLEGVPAPDDGTLLDIELRDDGGIRLVIGRMTAELYPPTAAGGAVIMDGLGVASARRLIRWAVEVGPGLNGAAWDHDWPRRRL